MEFLDKLGLYLNRLLMIIAGIFLLGMIALTCANILLRLFWFPVRGTFELMGFFGAIVTAFALGYTQVNKGHIARAVLEANAYQTLDIMEAMKKDSGVELNSLKVDGGMVANELLMQFQSDLLNVPVIRPSITETTALGAAFAAGLAVEFWASMEDLKQYWSMDKIWQPLMDDRVRQEGIRGWRKAVQRTLDWVD